MAFIDAHTPFDPDGFATEVVGLASTLGRHDSGVHQHRKAQLLYAPQGCITVTLNHLRCVLPPSRAAWIPANTPHCVEMINVVAYRSLWFSPSVLPCDPDSVKVVQMNPLLQALIERMAFWPWDKPYAEMQATLALFFEEWQHTQQEPLALPMPTDRRLQQAITRWRQTRQPLPTLSALSQQVGASEKTLTRVFQRETGMSWQAWRQQWRLLHAIEWLAEPVSISEVAYQLGFSSDSAFIAFFRQHWGQTPHQFRQVTTR